jgi:hypothetical protein
MNTFSVDMVRFKFVDSHKVVAYRSTFSSLVNILNKIISKNENIKF